MRPSERCLVGRLKTACLLVGLTLAVAEDAETAGSEETCSSTEGCQAPTLAGWQLLCQEVAALRAERPVFVKRLGELYAARQQFLTSPRRLLLLREKDADGAYWGAAGGAPGANTSSASEVSSSNLVDDCVALAGSAGTGPWKLKVDLAGSSEGHRVYATPQRVLLVFEASYPFQMPTIRWASRIANAYLESSDESDSGKKFGVNLHTYTPNPLLTKRLREAASTKVEPTVGADGEKGLPQRRYSLKAVLETLQKSLAGPLHSKEAKRWKQAANDFAESAETVLKYERYGRKHQRLYEIGGVTPEEAVEPELLALMAKSKAAKTRAEAKRILLGSGLIKEILAEDVFSFRLLKKSFCEFLMEEISHFYASKLPARRPNSMNNYGIILSEIGLDPLVFFLQDTVVQPLAAVLLPEEGSELESYHAFTIRYRGGEDTHLDVHTDDSDVTLNVNILGNYTGAPLVFCGINGAPDHRQFGAEFIFQLGDSVLHRGRHRHGAEDITSGDRMNLVIWSYSYNYRSSLFIEPETKKEIRRPDKRCVSYTHDRDYAQFKAYPPGKKEQFFGRGWAPKRGKEYDGFVPDVKDEDLHLYQPKRRLARDGGGGK
eukprot:TRINITY_DN60019_c0_g1_i1.p1 TRINITY_DN60019_c0_g1~~TRINITY_DN60019_c0_g1_i1.p1  ORF type:complete len:603 (+),score=136.51 TRINITY_DN60019_c0_g1_i1:128-1936(+)